MTKPASIKRGFLRHLLQKTEEEGDAQLGFAVRDKVLGDPDWQQVRQLSSLDQHLVLKRYMSRLNMTNRRPNEVIIGAFLKARAGVGSRNCDSCCQCW